MFIYDENIAEIIMKGREALLPPREISTTEWADENRYLPATANIPGKYNSRVTPHVTAIQNAFDDVLVEEITFMGSAQIGKTTILENIIGKIIDVDPQPILFMAPTKDVAKIFKKEKLDPMLETTPSLRNKISKRKAKDSDNTALYLKFIGGFIVFVGANSPHGLRQLSIPIIISDDIDSIEIGSTKEGDPVLRAEKRSQTFLGRRKKVRCSTPTILNSSRIHSFYMQGTQEEYYVYCPHCGERQVLNEDNITWEKQKDLFSGVVENFPGTATVACKNGCIITEQERREILLNGTAEFVAKYPERKKHRSFRISEISSTLSTLEEIAKAIIDAGDDPEKLETLHNLVFGRPYKREEAEELDDADFIKRCEDYYTEDNPFIPDGVQLITMGVDVQKDRIEFEIVGWGVGEESWSLVYDKIYGSFDDKKVQDELDKILDYTFIRTDKVELKIKITFIDSGYQTPSKAVYEFVRYRRNRGVYAIKGVGGYGKRLLYGKHLAHNKTIELITIGVNEAKMIIYSRLKRVIEPGPKYLHFNSRYNDSEYFQMLTAEKAVKKNTGVLEYVIYKKKKENIRNEALDCRIYAYAAQAFLLPKYEKLKEKNDRIALSLKETEPDKVTEPQLFEESEKSVKEKPGMKSGSKKIKVRKKITNYF